MLRCFIGSTQYIVLYLLRKCKSMTDSITTFWEWFQINSDRLLRANESPDSKHLFDEISSQLESVQPGLTFELGPPSDAKREFMVSADGIVDYFPIVIQLVESAPPIEQWAIFAFRQPQGTTFNIQFGEQELAPADIWFRLTPDMAQPKKVVLDLYIRNYNSFDSEFLTNASFILLDTALGEYTVATKIGGIARHELSANPELNGLQPFKELPAAVSQFVMSA